jgi:hypothetical protein
MDGRGRPAERLIIMSEFISICPKCRQQILCCTEYIGNRVMCPVCLQEITMPETPSGAPAVAPGNQPPSSSGRTVLAEPAAGAPAGGRQRFPLLVAGAIVLILAAGLGVFVLQRSSPAASPANPVPAAKSNEAAEAKLVDWFQPGQEQSELDHKLRGQNTGVGMFNDRSYRHATNGGWFAFEMKVEPAKTSALVCTWWGGEDGFPRAFDILLDEQKIATQTLRTNQPGRFWDVTYVIPADLLAGKPKVTVKLAAKPGNFAGGMFDCRLLAK